jgi:membrane fusion protein, multidrug efflux system
MKSTKQILGIAVVGIISSLLSVACGGGKKPAESKGPVVDGVRTARVALTSIEDSYEATGTVRSKTTVVVSSKLMAAITSFPVREGDRVTAGQLLVQLDSRDATAQLDKAKAGEREARDALAEVEQAIRAGESGKTAADANRALAAATFNRYETLLERRSVSPQEFDEVQAKHRVAEAEAERADRMLQTLHAKRDQVRAKIAQAEADIASARVTEGYTRIVSPIAGAVTARQADIGYTAAPGAPLLTVEDDSHYRFEASVEESRMGTIRVGDQVKIRIDALGDEESSGKVSEVVSAADPASRSYIVKIDLPSGKGEGRARVRSGLFGRARFAGAETRQAITIPKTAIVERGQLIGVYVVDNQGVARLRLLKTGKIYGDAIEVLSGLGEGEEIVVTDVASVSDGARVR